MAAIILFLLSNGFLFLNPFFSMNEEPNYNTSYSSHVKINLIIDSGFSET
jgi:hypothetical protein